MFYTLSIAEKAQWLECLKGFPQKDVYYLPEYSRLCMQNGEGYPLAAY
ncbi:MAG: hypothetical protein PHT78_11850 [Desulfitobacteriaceae bacterium]|nr:hypothetical protein [Desulfitobacteriaceae bacterium]